MKQQIVFIHGGEAFSKYEEYLKHLRTVPVDPFFESPKRWKDKLSEKLGDTYEVYFPQMPNKHNAKYEEWKIWFERHFEFLHDDVVLIGHSQGGYFLSKYLIENDMPISVKALYLIAAPIGVDDFGGEDGGDFDFDIEKLPKIAEKVSNIAIFHSKNDAVVPYKHAIKYEKALPSAELVTFEDKGHFLMEEFPELVAHIEGLT